MAYPTYTENGRFGDCVTEIVAEAYTRKQVTILSGSNVQTLPLKPCTLLGMITASKKYVPLNPAATDGSQNAAGILFDTVDSSDGDVAAAVVVRGPALVNWDGLVLVNALNNTQIATAKTQLAALLIQVRE